MDALFLCEWDTGIRLPCMQRGRKHRPRGWATSRWHLLGDDDAGNVVDFEFDYDGDYDADVRVDDGFRTGKTCEQRLDSVAVNT